MAKKKGTWKAPWLQHVAAEPPPGTKDHPLADVDEPNLFRDQFPYSEVPKLAFDGETVPLAPAEDIWVTDTTFRDGQQARPPYEVEDVVHVYKLLNRLGGPNGVVRQSEFFLYSEKDREALEKCQELGYEYPEITGWIRAVPADFELVKQVGLEETGILTSISDYHIFMKFKKTRAQVLENFMKVVGAAAEAGLKAVRCHFEDMTRADFWGTVVPFAERLMRFSEESGMKIRIRICDTMGYGVPWAEAALPRSVPKLVYYLRTELGIPHDQLEFHGHNDFHLVLANPVAAWLYGCSAANASLLGIGERTGNSPLEALCVKYASLKGTVDGMDLTAIKEIAEYFSKNMGWPVPSNYPFAGNEFNVTRAGIHADGVIKNEEIYNIFDTGDILGRPLGISVTDKSGVAGIALWLNRYLGLEGENQIDKRHPGIQAIAKWVEEQYAARRTTAISSEEMLEQAQKHLADLFA
ncbi:MAG TPA: 2-isopropylmalate synthase [bacterium]|nr:2-isopropylmalate synthase [bacterium]